LSNFPLLVAAVGEIPATVPNLSLVTFFCGVCFLLWEKMYQLFERGQAKPQSLQHFINYVADIYPVYELFPFCFLFF
jgi:TRAP-type C4-dicarboxylate transport system permease small subunit